MNCQELARRLSHHTDAALDGDDCAAIERHLRECEVCGALRRDLEDLARLCRESKRPTMPADVRRRIETLLLQG
ncbi:MAG TPA: zf-HC2 domain-containing protein [Vicinamibacteria bacterium]|jgi:predicted anti-sigma-YlaC factor YlaD